MKIGYPNFYTNYLGNEKEQRVLIYDCTGTKEKNLHVRTIITLFKNEQLSFMYCRLQSKPAYLRID